MRGCPRATSAMARLEYPEVKKEKKKGSQQLLDPRSRSSGGGRVSDEGLVEATVRRGHDGSLAKQPW